MSQPNQPSLSDPYLNAASHDYDFVAASYGRKSDDDDEGVDKQHGRNVRKAREDGGILPEGRDFRFGDNDSTGRNSERDDFARLVRIVTSDSARFSRVYVKDNSRFGRWADLRMRGFYEVLFKEHGVEVVYCNKPRRDYEDGIDSDDLGWLLKDFIDDLNAHTEAVRIVTKTTEGRREQVMKGSYPGKAAPYATERWYVDGVTGEYLCRVEDRPSGRASGELIKLRWVAEETAVVREIFELIEQGLSMAKIGRVLEERGIPAPSGGTTWHPESVRQVAKRPIYRGDLVWGRTTREGDPVDHRKADPADEAPILHRDFAPNPPVSRSQWKSVQKVLQGNRAGWDRRRNTSDRFLLSGLVVCASCGVAYHGHSRPPRVDGSRLRYYRHGRAKAVARVASPAEKSGAPETCEHRGRHIEVSRIEVPALAAVESLLSDDRLQRATEQAIEDRTGHEQLEAVAQEAKSLTSTIAKLARAVERASKNAALAEHEAERTAHRRTVRELSQKVERLRARLEHTGSEQRRLELVRRQVSSPPPSAVDMFNAAGVVRQKEVIAGLVHHIEVNPDSAEITLAVKPLPS